MKCEVCENPIEEGLPFYEVIQHVPTEKPDTVYLGSVECFIEWTTSMAAHFLLAHMLPDFADAERAIEQDRDRPRGGDPKLN
jgi:hypothetical protein